MSIFTLTNISFSDNYSIKGNNLNWTSTIKGKHQLLIGRRQKGKIQLYLVWRLCIISSEEKGEGLSKNCDTAK